MTADQLITCVPEDPDEESFKELIDFVWFVEVERRMGQTGGWTYRTKLVWVDYPDTDGPWRKQNL